MILHTWEIWSGSEFVGHVDALDEALARAAVEHEDYYHENPDVAPERVLADPRGIELVFTI